MKYILFFILANTNSTFSQTFIDSVYSFRPGTGQAGGQSEIYYPRNIFGPPAFLASKQAPEVSPEEILSLGLNGEIILGYKNGVMENKEGVDFIIFENAFEISFNNKIYAEPAIVSVSENGVEWYTFEYNLDELTGLAGTNFTIGNNPNSEYGFSGGNAFDLNDLGLNQIKYIKLKDTTEHILNNPSHNNYDPTLSGFDLDAVFILYPKIETVSVPIESHISQNIIGIYDFKGNKIQSINERGMYFIVYENGVRKLIKY